VLELVVVLNDDMTRGLEARGLTGSRAHLVWELRRRGPVSQRVLADALRVSPRAVTGLVDALVADGLVTREPHPTDRRAVVVTFTAKGDEVAAQLERDHQALARALFGEMPRAELERFTQSVVDVVARLRAHQQRIGTAKRRDRRA
jgi:DNA-binding MarR family transcriptional regulator